jgi:DNA-binding NarL/FixJ family response regulator
MSVKKNPTQRVLIASGHPLFGEGLVSLLENRWKGSINIVGLVSSIEETKTALKKFNPDLLIIDYSNYPNREELLKEFIRGSRKLRVVLVSLLDGNDGAEAIVYDRRTMAASKIEDWLEITPTTDQLDQRSS